MRIRILINQIFNLKIIINKKTYYSRSKDENEYENKDWSSEEKEKIDI